MKNLKRKGFTIVELVIVIAVIAVLAAVLIPTFSNVINKANFTSDISAVRNMNTILSVAKVTDGKVDSVSEARTALSEAGFDTEDLKATTTGYEFYWNSTYNVILLVDCSKAEESQWEVVYPEEGYEEAISEFDDMTTRNLKNFRLSNIPNAKVEPISVSLNYGEIFGNGGNWNGIPFANLGADEFLDLDVALNFKANETGAAAKEAGYADWIVDFIIIVSEDLEDYTANDKTQFYLAGQYDAFEDQWVVMNASHIGVTGGTKNYLLRDFGFVFTYEAICDSVQNFNCGVAVTGEDPIGLTITVQLVMFETSEHYEAKEVDHIIYEYNHTF